MPRRSTTDPWETDHGNGKTRPAVDMQYIRREEAIPASGIVLIQPQPASKGANRCEHCGSFISESQVFFGCPKCGESNAP